jgi:YidC/Oxa1 family membrane protein insertase
MTDIRRTLLWMVFTMSLVFLWDAWNKHTGQPSWFSPAPPRAAASAPPAAGSTTATTAAVPTIGASAAAVEPAANVVPPTGVANAGGEQTVITTDLLKVTLDSRGADVVRVELLTQVDQSDRNKQVVLLERSVTGAYVAQTGLIGAPNLPNQLTLFSRTAGETTLSAGRDALSVVFEAAEQGGVRLKKTYTFRRGQYTVDVKHEVQNTSAATLSPRLYLQLARDARAQGGSNFFAAPQSFVGPAVYTQESNYQKIEFKSIEKGDAKFTKSADNGWVAMVQHYFFSAWLHDGKATRDFYTLKHSDYGFPVYAVGQMFALGEIAPGASREFDSRLYVGPQEEKQIEALAPGLELVKDYGIFTVIAKPLFWLLDQMHRLLGNWGWAIVGLVVLLKIAFYWLNASAYRSMGKMKALAPRITDMRERYKDKPQLMQQEMMRIYREEKVNPLGGCLPIVAQMPFFLALYWVLLSSVEMRNAPWIGWVHDLAVPDPWFVLPLLMMLSSLFQVWLQPAPADPTQAKMMWMMPLIFGVMFFFFPAGLVLYWLTNNILSIAQQWWINRQLGVK